MELTEQEIVENIRVIAEFMGYNVIPYQHRPIYNGNKFVKYIGEERELWNQLNMEFTGRFVESVKYPFHADFSYLIPVIRRIEEQGYVVSVAGISYKIYRVLEEDKPIVSIGCGDLKAKTRLTYDLIVNFLKLKLI